METVVTDKMTTGFEYPSLSDRAQSIFIDSIFIVVLMFIAGSILEKYEDAPTWIRIVLFFGLWAVYEPVCTSLGFTLGNYAKGIRVRKISNPQKKINIIQAFFRYLVKAGLGWLSFISIHFNPEKRAIHDLAVGSVMIKK
jgi:uncharacterized RDD family membrane protein YckC